jgi:hypothetical protein
VNDEQTKSYPRRNLVLAVIAGVFAVAAIVKVVSTAKPEAAGAPAATISAPVSAPAAPATATQPPAAAAASGAPIIADVAYAGALDALPESAKVYVFVRPVGQRMPLAVQTFTPRDLPVAVEFSSPTSPTPAGVEVVARLSISGEVAMQPGDLEVVSSVLQFGQTPQTLSLALGGPNASASPAAAAGAAAAPQQAAGALSIPVHLALGAGVTLPPTTTVFLIVRATDGSPMPLAVKRFVVADLPKDLSLTQADAMVPGRSIAAAQTIELVGRASVDGNVKPVPGDFEGHSGVLKIADITSPIVLTIDQPL